MIRVFIDFPRGPRITGTLPDASIRDVADLYRTTAPGSPLILEFSFADGRTVLCDRDKVLAIVLEEVKKP